MATRFQGDDIIYFHTSDSTEAELFTTANLPVNNTHIPSAVPRHSTPYVGEGRTPFVSFPPTNLMSELHISPQNYVVSYYIKCILFI